MSPSTLKAPKLDKAMFLSHAISAKTPLYAGKKDMLLENKRSIKKVEETDAAPCTVLGLYNERKP